MSDLLDYTILTTSELQVSDSNSNHASIGDVEDKEYKRKIQQHLDVSTGNEITPFIREDNIQSCSSGQSPDSTVHDVNVTDLHQITKKSNEAPIINDSGFVTTSPSSLHIPSSLSPSTHVYLKNHSENHEFNLLPDQITVTHTEVLSSPLDINITHPSSCMPLSDNVNNSIQCADCATYETSKLLPPPAIDVTPTKQTADHSPATPTAVLDHVTIVSRSLICDDDEIDLLSLLLSPGKAAAPSLMSTPRRLFYPIETDKGVKQSALPTKKLRIMIPEDEDSECSAKVTIDDQSLSAPRLSDQLVDTNMSFGSPSVLMSPFSSDLSTSRSTTVFQPILRRKTPVYDVTSPKTVAEGEAALLLSSAKVAREREQHHPKLLIPMEDDVDEHCPIISERNIEGSGEKKFRCECTTGAKSDDSLSGFSLHNVEMKINLQLEDGKDEDLNTKDKEEVIVDCGNHLNMLTETIDTSMPPTSSSTPIKKKTIHFFPGEYLEIVKIVSINPYSFSSISKSIHMTSSLFASCALFTPTSLMYPTGSKYNNNVNKSNNGETFCSTPSGAICSKEIHNDGVHISNDICSYNSASQIQINTSSHREINAATISDEKQMRQSQMGFMQRYRSSSYDPFLSRRGLTIFDDADDDDDASVNKGTEDDVQGAKRVFEGYDQSLILATIDTNANSKDTSVQNKQHIVHTEVLKGKESNTLHSLNSSTNSASHLLSQVGPTTPVYIIGASGEANKPMTSSLGAATLPYNVIGRSKTKPLISSSVLYANNQTGGARVLSILSGNNNSNAAKAKKV